MNVNTTTDEHVGDPDKAAKGSWLKRLEIPLKRQIDKIR